jgi:hypothetical protein
MSKLKSLCAVVLVIAACGGKQKTGPGPTVDETGEHTDPPPDNSGNMIPPEKMDEVSNDLKRKANIISRCLADAMETKDVPRGAHGKVTIEIVVGTGGKADSVKVVNSDFRQAPKVDDCVVKHVQEISFPTLPKSYETSFTYPMEAN